MSEIKNKEILGMTEKQYGTYFYYGALGGMAVGIVDSLLSFIGVNLSILNSIEMITGYGALLMAILGGTIFKESFSNVAISHFKFYMVLFLIMIITMIVLGGAISSSLGSIVAHIIILGVSLLFVAVMWCAFQLWKSDEKADHESVYATFRKFIKGK